VQQICRKELDIQKTTTRKRTLEDLNIEERQVKLLKMRADIEHQKANTEKKNAEAKAIERKSEAEAKALVIKAEAESKKIEAEAKKIEAEAKKIEINAKHATAEEYRKQLYIIERVDKNAKCNGPLEEFWKQYNNKKRYQLFI